ncbi:MAG: hypothetical protein P8N50_12265, partial [Actinomycetota bacterium]|nr:hypothetical protein [Actinomycetota bacterium]
MAENPAGVEVRAPWVGCGLEIGCVWVCRGGSQGLAAVCVRAGGEAFVSFGIVGYAACVFGAP